MPAHWETFTDDDGKRRYRLVGGNGEIMLTSEGLEGDRYNAHRGIAQATLAVVEAGEQPIEEVD